MTDQPQLIDSQISEDQQIDERVFFGLIQRVGSMGNYQRISTLLWCIMGYICGGLMLITPFLFYQDPYKCPDSITSCQSYVCSLPLQQRKDYIPSDVTMQSLANKFGDYRCHDEKIELDLIIFMMYVGAVIGFLISAVIGDHIGRKSLIMLCLVLNGIGLTITIFCTSIEIAGVGLFISTIGIQNGFNVCFYFLAETVSESHREKYSVAIQLFYGSGVLLNVPWFYLVRDWRLILIFFYLIPSVLVTVTVLLFVRDTPICLVLKHSIHQAYQSFTAIAKINKFEQCKIKEEYLQQIKDIYSHQHEEGEGKKKKKRFSVLDLFKFASLRWKTIMLIIVQCTIIFEFYAPALMLDKFKMDIFINGLVVGVSEIISYPICYFLIMKSRRRMVAYLSFGAAVLCSIALTFVWDQNSEQEGDLLANIGVLALIFVFRFAISCQYTFFYIYFNEVYPTQIRVLGTSLVSLMGAAMVTVAPLIIDFCIHGGFPVMVLFAILSGISIFLSNRLPQTFQLPLPDIIDELKEEVSLIATKRQASVRDLLSEGTNESVILSLDDKIKKQTK